MTSAVQATARSLRWSHGAIKRGRGRGPLLNQCGTQIQFSSVSNNDPEPVLPVEAASKSKSALLHSFEGYTDEKIVEMSLQGKISAYRLEQELKRSVNEGLEPDCSRAVRVRRLYLQGLIEESAKAKTSDEAMAAKARNALTISEESSSVGLPYNSFDHESFYRSILGKNCENVIGFIPYPVGVAGPILMDNKKYHVPMATTEGALVASTNRGCRAITESGGVFTQILNDGMTRAPALRLRSAKEAADVYRWVQQPENLETLRAAFSSTTNYGRLLAIKPTIAGRSIHLRFKCFTGDAMGMNMISKGVLECLDVLEKEFPTIDVLSVSGNTCTDKKPSAMNWIEGRGKSVVAEAVLSSHVVVDVLKCTVPSLVDLNIAKNLMGSTLAGSIGGSNAHAANVVTACFLATGQDPAQNVESSNCMTLMEADEGGSLRVSVTMPCIEVGTVGGGTSLPAQKACLDMLGLAGSSGTPGENAQQLARIIASTVLAGEISLMAALASNHLVSAHMKLNRAEKPKEK